MNPLRCGLVISFSSLFPGIAAARAIPLLCVLMVLSHVDLERVRSPERGDSFASFAFLDFWTITSREAGKISHALVFALCPDFSLQLLRLSTPWEFRGRVEVFPRILNHWRSALSSKLEIFNFWPYTLFDSSMFQKSNRQIFQQILRHCMSN